MRSMDELPERVRNALLTVEDLKKLPDFFFVWVIWGGIGGNGPHRRFIYHRIRFGREHTILMSCGRGGDGNPYYDEEDVDSLLGYIGKEPYNTFVWPVTGEINMTAPEGMKDMWGRDPQIRIYP